MTMIIDVNAPSFLRRVMHTQDAVTKKHKKLYMTRILKSSLNLLQQVGIVVTCDTPKTTKSSDKCNLITACLKHLFVPLEF